MTLNIRDFGDALIRTGDLDPVYYVRKANLPEPQLCRWLLAYWCFYHAGSASFLSDFEGDDYWGMMKEAAKNNVGPKYFKHISHGPDLDRWPRAAERRHFRGDKCVKAIEWLARDRGSPEEYVCHLASRRTDVAVMNYVQTWPLFGPWIAFKAADMMERVYGATVQFSGDIGLVYKEPRAGLEMFYKYWDRGESLRTCYAGLLGYFAQHQAPPTFDRPCGPQEVETILCKWKSHVNGGYEIGKDIREVRHALAHWGETAARVSAQIPEEVTT